MLEYSVRMRIESVREPLPAGAVAGVELIVEGSRGNWRVEAVDGRHWAIIAGTGLVLAVALDAWWSGAAFVRGPGWTSPFPHISAVEARARASRGSNGEGWLSRFAELLAASPLTGLHTDTWWLLSFIEASRPERGYSTAPYGVSLPWPPVPPGDFEAVLRFEPAWVEEWGGGATEQPRPGDVVALRRPSLAEDGRVKAWRRALREGVLPPALLLYNPLIERYFVLDGHDRIHAALLEGGVPPTVACYPVAKVQQPGIRKDPGRQMVGVESVVFSPFEKTPGVIERMNREAREAYGEVFARPVFSARAFRGGVGGWSRMIDAVLGDRDAELRGLFVIDDEP
jgi:hypothetical protein